MASEVSTVPGYGAAQQFPIAHSLEIRTFGGNGSSSPNSNSSSSNGNSSSSGKDEVGKLTCYGINYVDMLIDSQQL